MNYMPNMYADIIPFKNSAGFNLGMNFNDFVCNIKYIKATDKIISNWYSDDNSIVDEEVWHIQDEIVHDFFDENISERVVSCYWNKDILLVFCGDDCILKSITVCGNYKGKLLGNVSIGDNLNDLYKIYDFYFYADCNYLMYKNKNDEVVGAEIITNYLSEYDELLSDQVIKSIRIYLE